MRDQAAPYWALGLFLLAGGLLCLAMTLGLAPNAGALKQWERVASLLVGLGVCAGALWWLARNPTTRVELDLTRRTLRLVRTGILGRKLRQLGFNQLEGVELQRGADSEGDPVWRPAVRLRGGELLPLSRLWDHDEAGLRKSIWAVADACELPAPTGMMRSVPPGSGR